jgi:hypothetical protein
MEDKAVDYKLYSFFQNNYIYDIDNKRYVPKKHPEHGNLTRAKLLEIYNKKCPDASEKISLRTLSRKMSLFASIGMISEGRVINKEGVEVSAYIVLENYEFFQYIPLETLIYLVDTASSTVIKLYALLLNKYLWKERSGNKYTFTFAELAEDVGLRDNNNGNTRIISNCLNSLASVDLIEYKEYYQTTASGRPTPRKVLVRANLSYKKVSK